MKNWSSRLYPPSSNPPMGIQYASNQRSCSSIENGLTELGRKNQKTLKDAGNPTLKEKACKSCSTNVDFRRNGMIRKDHGILCYQQYCISCHKINISDKNNAKKKTRAKEGGCYECNLPATQGKYCQRHYDDYNEHNAKVCCPERSNPIHPLLGSCVVHGCNLEESQTRCSRVSYSGASKPMNAWSVCQSIVIFD